MGTDVIVLLAIRLQPGPPALSGWFGPLGHGRFQAAVAALNFPLRLRMSISAQMQTNALPHQPYRQPGPARCRLHVPPRRAVIHQHCLRKTVPPKYGSQIFLYRLGLGAGGSKESQQVTAVILD